MTYRIDPSRFTHAGLASDLAAWFGDVAPEVPGSINTLASAIKRFVEFVDSQMDLVGEPDSLASIRRRHLDDWETYLRAGQRRVKTDTAYRYAVHLFALLRRIEHDAPGSLRREVVERLEMTTRLPHVRRNGDPEFAPPEIRALRSAAHRVIYRARQRVNAGNRRAPLQDEILALQVLLVLATGEPVEVIRRVTMSDITATATPGCDAAISRMTPTQRTDHLVLAGSIDQLSFNLYKARAGQAYTETLTRGSGAAFAAWCYALYVTAAARQDSHSDLLWIVASPSGPVSAPYPEMRLRRWVRSHVINPSRISEPVAFRRLRKTQTSREILAGPSRYLRDGRRHSDATFFAHYANSRVLRAEAGKVLVTAIQQRFGAATAGPTIVTPAAERVMDSATHIPDVGFDIDAIKSGANETPMSACIDPVMSPHAPQGAPCPVAATGACFACPNAVILERHLPAALRLLERTNPDKAADLDIWTTLWKPIHDAIKFTILPAFPPEVVVSAQADVADVLLDAGLLNDLGDPDAH